MKLKFFAGTLVLAILLTLVGPVLAQGGGPPDWDRSSISVSARCDGNDAVFTITNGGSGNMAGPSTYTLSNGGGGSFGPLASGASTEIRVASNGVKIEIVVYQRPGHPGTGQAKADATCGTRATPTTPPPLPTNTPTATATNTLEPNENSANIEPRVDCNGDWMLNLWASEGAAVTGETSGNLGTGSVHYNVDVTFPDGAPLSFHFEGDLNYPSEECGGDNTPTPPDQPTATATATKEPPPPPAGGLYVKKSTRGPASAFLNIPGLHTIDGVPFDYTCAAYGGCQAIVEVWGPNVHLSLSSTDGLAIFLDGIFYADTNDGIGSMDVTQEFVGFVFGIVENGYTGQFEVREGEAMGGGVPGVVCPPIPTNWSRSYCGWIVNILPQDATPLPPPVQPTAAPLQNTGAGGAGGLLAFGGLLALLVVTGGVSFGLGAKKR